MKRTEKIELLKGIAEGRTCVHDLKGCVIIVQKEGKNYLSDGNTIGRELPDDELNLIRAPKIFIDEDDLRL
jgi:hypothetical protein